MTYIDISTTCALYGFDLQARTQKSRHLDVSFFENMEVTPEHPLIIEARVERFEEDFAHTMAKLLCGKTGKPIATGKHIKTLKASDTGLDSEILI